MKSLALLIAFLSLQIQTGNILKKGAKLFKKEPVEAVDFSAWRDTSDLKKTSESGLPLFYPEGKEDGVTVCGEISVPGKNALEIFLGALNYAIDNLDVENEIDSIVVMDPGSKSFVVELLTTAGAYSKEASFDRLVEIRGEDGRLVFVNSDITVKFRDKGIIPKTLSFGELNPVTNPRDLNFIEQFADLNSEYLYAMTAGISESGPLEISHWKEIQAGQVVPGMNKLEVKLVLGLPVAHRENDAVTRWIYPRNLIVLFENGKVQKVID